VDNISIELTKQQWEEIYQWYLIVKDDYRIENFGIAAGEKIAQTLINKYGKFN
jgi:hypothetical protein